MIWDSSWGKRRFEGEFSVDLFIPECNAAAGCQAYMRLDFFLIFLSFFFFFLLIDNPWIQEESLTYHVDMAPERKYS